MTRPLPIIQAGPLSIDALVRGDFERIVVDEHSGVRVDLFDPDKARRLAQWLDLPNFRKDGRLRIWSGTFRGVHVVITSKGVTADETGRVLGQLLTDIRAAGAR